MGRSWPMNRESRGSTVPLQTTLPSIVGQVRVLPDLVGGSCLALSRWITLNRRTSSADPSVWIAAERRQYARRSECSSRVLRTPRPSWRRVLTTSQGEREGSRREATSARITPRRRPPANQRLRLSPRTRGETCPRSFPTPTTLEAAQRERAGDAGYAASRLLRRSGSRCSPRASAARRRRRRRPGASGR